MKPHIAMKRFASPTVGRKDREVLGDGSEALEILGMRLWSSIAMTHGIAT